MMYTRVAQGATSTTVQAPLYPFLSQPPQKKCPTQPLPSTPTEVPTSPERAAPGRRRSATIAAITAWRAEVNPGSPAPYSPRRSPLVCGTRRASGSRRLSCGSVRAASGSYFAITPSVDAFKEHDFTSVGYTSFFVRLPATPISPEQRRPMPPPQPFSPTKRALKLTRSLTSLKPTKRVRSHAPPSPLFNPGRASAEFRRSRALSNAAIVKGKKSKYAKYRPAPLANDLALTQFLDGGSMEENIRRYNKSQAKISGAEKVDGMLIGVGDVWRDGVGGIWRDKDEEWEFAHLLGDADNMDGWVAFNSPQPSADGMRRESVSTQDSDLSPRFAMQVDDPADDLAAFDTPKVTPGMPLLALPARSRRTAKHLRKPAYLLNAFPVPRSSNSPQSPRPTAHTVARSAGKARRRPAPLQLVPQSPAQKVATNPDADPDQLRADFLMDSFRPRPRLGRSRVLSPRIPPTPQGAVCAVSRDIRAKPSVLNMRGFLKATLGSRKVCAL